VEQPEPSAEDQQFLSVVSTRAPSMRATYENQLQAVNADIGKCRPMWTGIRGMPTRGSI
jgi:hypothetical protein